ncbi:MAG: acetylglutamate kinase [Gammaproteobacteria bacterium]|nr:acetylglutamate kinase [Gammaproteobacteria bacterium]
MTPAQSTRPAVAVVKVGGDVLASPDQLRGLGDNLNDLLAAGRQCVVMHGAGPQLAELQSLYGVPENKVAGRRITGPQELRMVKQALCGEANVDLVSALRATGVAAFGCHGASGGLIKAVRRPPRQMAPDSDPIDFGLVGDVVDVNTALLHGLLELRQVPVIASLGISHAAEVFNINADTTAIAVAQALHAECLIMTTAVGGIFRDLSKPDSRIAKLNSADAKLLIAEGVIKGGMVAKVEEAFNALQGGVGMVAITDALPGRFISAIGETGDSGTLLVRH